MTGADAPIGFDEAMARLERYMQGLVESPVLWLSQPARHLLSAGGKRLRAALVFRAAELAGGAFVPTTIYAAAAVELVHAASLVHDDLIDQSPHRRGRPTIHEKWHHDAAVLVGDYLFALAARAITLTGNIRVLEEIAEAAVAICEGEISSVDEVEPLEAALESYRFKIGRKTASLFGAAGRIGAICGGAGQETVAAMGAFGYALGMAFQIVDDVLDYVGDERVLGKPAGGDLRRGLITLPLIYAVAHDDADGFLRRAIARFGEPFSEDEFAAVLQRVQNSSGPRRAREEALRYSEEALAHLRTVADPERRAPLEEIARRVVERSS